MSGGFSEKEKQYINIFSIWLKYSDVRDALPLYYELGTPASRILGALPVWHNCDLSGLKNHNFLP